MSVNIKITTWLVRYITVNVPRSIAVATIASAPARIATVKLNVAIVDVLSAIAAEVKLYIWCGYIENIMCFISK